jgi:hypothetical protein
MPPARTELADAVSHELRETALAVADKAVSPHWQPVSAAEATDALGQVVHQVDPDLGFRLFLRLLLVLSVPVTSGQYERYRSIGKRFGYGEYHVDEIEHLVQ